MSRLSKFSALDHPSAEVRSRPPEPVQEPQAGAQALSRALSAHGVGVKEREIVSNFANTGLIFT